MVHISFLTQNHSTQERDSPYLTVFIGRLLYNTFWFVLNILDLNSFWFSCLVFTFLWKLLYNLFILAVPDSLLCYIPFVWLQCFVYLSDSKVQPNGTWIMIHHEVLNFQDWILFFFNWDSPHARLNWHYEAWSYKKRSTKRMTGYRKWV